MMHEVRAAARRLSRAPGFTLFSVGTLALGIAATTTCFAILYAEVWRRSPVGDTSGLVVLTQGASASRSAASWQDVLAIDEQRIFDRRALWGQFPAALAGGGTSRLVEVEAVSGEYFSLLRMTPEIGRLIQPFDDLPEAGGVVVLSNPLWRTQFGGDSAVIGQTVRVGGQTAVVGVAPSGFSGIGSGRIRAQNAVSDEMLKVPGVAHVLAGTHLPLSLPWSPLPHSAVTVTGVPGGVESVSVEGSAARLSGVSHDFIRALGMQVLHGRAFEPQDVTAPEIMVIVTESLAKALYGTTRADGRIVYWRHTRMSAGESTVRSATIVGVVDRGAEGPDSLSMFAPYTKTHLPSAVLGVVSTHGDATPLIAALDRAGPTHSPARVPPLPDW
jgi:hypothetical protein